MRTDSLAKWNRGMNMRAFLKLMHPPLLLNLDWSTAFLSMLLNMHLDLVLADVSPLA